MRNILVVLLIMLPGAAAAHEDRILPIKPDGTLAGLPDQYGPVKVQVERSSSDARKVQSVVLASPRFRVSLNQCVIDRLNNVNRVEASGSWYHEHRTLPPYVSLTFYSGRYDPSGVNNQYYSVTYSLVDGRILMGEHAWDPLLGAWRAKVANPADNARTGGNSACSLTIRSSRTCFVTPAPWQVKLAMVPAPLRKSA